MKKYIPVMLIVLCLAFSSTKVFAEEIFDESLFIEDSGSYSEETINSDYGTGGEDKTSEELSKEVLEDVQNQIDNVVPEQTENILEENNITQDGNGEVKNFSIGTMFNIIKDEIFSNIKEPISLFGNLMFILIITSLFYGFNSSFLNQSLSKVISFVTTISVTTILIEPIINSIDVVSATIEECSVFLKAFIPIFGSLLTASGKPISTVTYSTLLFMLSQFVSFAIANIIVPVILLFLAFSLSGCVNDTINIEPITNGVKKTTYIVLGIMITVFVSFLTLQGIVASSGDAVSLKAGKFLVGNFVPVIGGAITDALSSMYTYMGLIKNTTGVFGIVIMVITFLPSLIEICLISMFVYIASVISDVLSLNQITVLLKSIQSCFSIMIASFVTYIILIIITFTIIISVGVGV